MHQHQEQVRAAVVYAHEVSADGTFAKNVKMILNKARKPPLTLALPHWTLNKHRGVHHALVVVPSRLPTASWEMLFMSVWRMTAPNLVP